MHLRLPGANAATLSLPPNLNAIELPGQDPPTQPPNAAASPRVALPWRQKLSSHAGEILFVLAACLLCLGYFLYTDQTWEDSLITLRHSENLVKGEGLTYNPGARVHGFTSPINVLLLALCHLLTGQSSYGATFWLYRLLSIPAFAVSGVLLLKAIKETPPRWIPAAWFLAIVYLFDVKTVAFSTNGMETAFMLGFVAWAVYLLSRAEPDQWLLRGLCWGGLMWSRPDGFVYIAGFALAEWWFLATSRRATLVSLFKSAAVGLAVYAPWLIFAWSYYGNPIPHTIIAKANIELGALSQLFTTLDNFPASVINMASQAFRPIYYNDQTEWFGAGLAAWGRVLNTSTKLVGVVALLYFLYPVPDRFGRAVSLCFAVVCCYLSYMRFAYPWYFPPVTLLGVTAFTRAATMLALSARDRLDANGRIQPRKGFVLTMFALLAVGQIVLFWPASLEERIQQAEIEMGNRAAIGKWLKENASPTETVYLEPLGYIGYFSGLHMNDFPGLVSPEVVRLRRQLPQTRNSLRAARLLVIPKLKPDWVVLRFSEYQMLTQSPMISEFKRQYTFSRDFNVNDKLNQHHFLPGEVSLRYDAGFAVFRRNPAAN